LDGVGVRFLWLKEDRLALDLLALPHNEVRWLSSGFLWLMEDRVALDLLALPPTR